MADIKQKPTDGRFVTFTPNSAARNRNFHTAREDKKTFPAIIVDVNEKTVDLRVLNGKYDVFVARVPHVDNAEATESTWDWPEKV